MTRPPSDDQIDEALKGTFPASDPPGFTVETGIRLVMEPAPVSDIVLRDHREASRFEAVVDGAVAYLAYERGPKAFVLLHTEVPGSLRGKGVGHALAEFGLDTARTEGLPVQAVCPFVRAYMRRLATTPVRDGSARSRARSRGPDE